MRIQARSCAGMFTIGVSLLAIMSDANAGSAPSQEPASVGNMKRIIVPEKGLPQVIIAPTTDSAPANSPTSAQGLAADRDCADFATQAQAQAFFQQAGPGDPHGLDQDRDGRACELNGRFVR